MGTLLVALVLIPVLVRFWSKTHLPSHTWTVTAASFGLVAAPVGIGLYGTCFVGPFGIVTGMLGLLLSMFHGAPGYYIATYLGWVPSFTVVESGGQLIVDAVSGLFWAAVYGTLGLVVDLGRRSRVAL